MDISLEKEEIIRKFYLVHDADLIKAIKSLLDFGLPRQEDEPEQDDDIALKASIERAISDSEKGLVRPYEEFMAEIRKPRSSRCSAGPSGSNNKPVRRGVRIPLEKA